MKLNVKLGLLVAAFSVFASCSNGQMVSVVPPVNQPVDSPETDAPSTAPSEGMSYLGNVNKIYSSSVSARFGTGQIIENFFGHKVRFEGNLVEYNSIKQEVLDYVESLESNNALMHQGYNNVKYDASKKYVEFSSYTDTTSNKVVCYEIRVFFGNFLETYNSNFWYAKSVLFNSNFTKDIHKNVTVNFGEPFGSEDPVELTYGNGDFQIPQNVDDNVNQQLIEAVGTPAHIYSAPNTSARLCTGQTITWGNKTVRFQGNLVAYSSVNSRVTSIFEDLNMTAMANQCYSNVTYDDSKTYIEVCYYEDVEDNSIVSYELRLIDGSYFTTPWNGKMYAKFYQFNNLSDIQ